MNKPDWGSAPECANQSAQDQNGGWKWFMYEPQVSASVDVYLYWKDKNYTHIGAKDLESIGPKEPRPKPKVRAVSLIGGQSVEFLDQGGTPFRRIFGPCTITITEP